MLENKHILICGGDLRNAALSKLLSCRNTVFTLGLEDAENSGGVLGGKKITMREMATLEKPLDYVILPIPAVDENGFIETKLSKVFDIQPLDIAVLLPFINSQTHVLGGKLNEKIRKKLDFLKITYTDYLLREELAIKNAVPTAEGAIEIAMRELPCTICGLQTLIIGYGRIGKVLAKWLNSMSCDVTVSARKFSDLAWIEVNGCKKLHTCELLDDISGFHLVFNTVPSMILNEELLEKLPRDCLVIDLASKPGGVDFDAAKRLNVKVIWALSLPGICAPVSAAEIIYDTIQNIDSERRYSLE